MSDGPDNHPLVDAVERALRRALARRAGQLLVAGICGAQGSGKSTLAAALKARFESGGIATAILSLDDLYLTKAEREALAAAVHPLFRTRGVPGTHDIGLGLKVIDALRQGRGTALPRFDKARDDRAPAASWDHAPDDTRLLLLEGWCVGARPQSGERLAEPVNRLERNEDAAGIWRRHANAALAGDYQLLFGNIGWLLLFAAPDFETVLDWRTEQEDALRGKAGADAPGLMAGAELARFVQHYERLTRHILSEMPPRADMVAELAPDRSVRRITERNRD